MIQVTTQISGSQTSPMFIKVYTYHYPDNEDTYLFIPYPVKKDKIGLEYKLKINERKREKELPKNCVTNSADPLNVIALLSCFVAAIFQICLLRKLGMKTVRTGTNLHVRKAANDSLLSAHDEK